MSDSAKLRYTYGIVQLILGIALFIACTIFVTLAIINNEMFAYLALFCLIGALFSLSNSISNFVACGEHKERDKNTEQK